MRSARRVPTPPTPVDRFRLERITPGRCVARQPATTLGSADQNSLSIAGLSICAASDAGDVECAGFSETSSVDGGPEEELADPPARGNRLQLVDPPPGGSPLGVRLRRRRERRARTPRSRGTCRAGGGTASARRRASREREERRPARPRSSPRPLSAMLSQHGSPTWQPRANACSKRASRRSDVAEDEVDLAAKRFRPRHERRHASRLDLFEGLVEEVDRVLDFPSQEVEAAQQGESLTQRLA